MTRTVNKTRHVRVPDDLGELLALMALATGTHTSVILDPLIRPTVEAWRRNNTNLVKRLKKARKAQQP